MAGGQVSLLQPTRSIQDTYLYVVACVSQVTPRRSIRLIQHLLYSCALHVSTAAWYHDPGGGFARLVRQTRRECE